MKMNNYRMAYVSLNMKNGERSMCLADPDVLIETIGLIRKWKEDGCMVRLLPINEANRFVVSREQEQMEMF